MSLFVLCITNKIKVIAPDTCESSLGIAGALYIPIVQAALPRLLGAAAPPGTGGRENRHQCHKVFTFCSFRGHSCFVVQSKLCLVSARC